MNVFAGSSASPFRVAPGYSTNVLNGSQSSYTSPPQPLHNGKDYYTRSKTGTSQSTMSDIYDSPPPTLLARFFNGAVNWLYNAGPEEPSTNAAVANRFVKS